ncbi:MAG: glycosyltransferase, partial [Nitrososphaeria archaeon]
RKDSTEILKRSKVFVYPSRLDSFALVVLESLSCGTPVVSYSIPAIRMNYLTEAVVKVKPLDVDSLIEESENILKNEKWVELGKAGKEYASKYSWEKVAASEWRILEKIYFYE